MKHIFCIALFCFCVLNLFAQNETIDLITFKVPDGWKKESKDGVISYFTVDKANGSWCRLNIYKSVASKGSIEADLEKEWKELVAGPNNITDPMEATATEEADGWKVKVASGKFVFQTKPAAAMLTTFSGYNRCASVVALTNSEQYLETIQNFIAAIDIKKPEAENVSQNNTVSSNTGSSFFGTTTNFDDGWVSTVKEDWVEVTKGDIKVYLYYALPYNASNFSGTGVVERDYYWDHFVSKYYNIETKQYKDNGEVLTSQKPPYVEGWAVNRQTGERRFIGMRLDISPNTAYITIGSAKDEAALWAQFPKANGGAWSPSDLSDMGGYNKFAVSENDILGTWQDGNTSTMQWYYTAPSGYEGYAGMTVAARSATFNFNSGGNYTSIHNGATGTVGAMNTFQQNYKGKYTVSNWNITATNRWEGKTESFNSWFKVIRGGRILCMDAGGMQYRLLKAK